ncbi:DUF3987 domain-containing protein [Agrobacterium tumefaciens]|uniref:DUF3987 domain-containing protein n=1 Tax=Agrobacterium tumefaciens TaxID=358 RepID=UPI0015742805|nr:DUF3987 domain-containing protein [Agrobacterium tumefaciens]NSZ83627.1 DUF3987 domain-containing protein [Agrobacterium tumefaciens]WCA69836.1 DUF3987 domain-containing protein [Agrobacterium tumefaciens]
MTEQPMTTVAERDALEDFKASAATRTSKESVAKQPLPEVTLSPVPKFDSATLLPPQLRWWVEDEARRVGGPIEFVATSAIAGAGAIVSPKRLVQLTRLNTDFKVAMTFWGACVGDPSTKKTPCTDAGFKHLKAVDKAASLDLKNQMLAYAKEEKIYKARVKAAESKVIGLSIGMDEQPNNVDLPQKVAEAKIALSLIEQQAPALPTSRQYIVNDTTIERLGITLQHSPGVLYFRDELMGLLHDMEKKDRASDRPFLLQAFNGTSGYKVERISRDDVYIEKNVLTLFGGIQPDKLRTLVQAAPDGTKDDDGFLARFHLMVFPDWEYMSDEDREPHAESFEAAQAVYAHLAQLPEAQEPLTFTETAIVKFRRWKDEHEKRLAESKDMPSGLRYALGKYVKLCGGLAGLFCLIDRKADVEDAHVEMAIAWCQFLEPHAARVYGLSQSTALVAAHMVLARKDRPQVADGFTAKKLQLTGWADVTKDNVQEILDILVEFGHLEKREAPRGPQGGRPSVQYFWQ